ncbi:MAG: HAD-IIA family hydrolase [Clostridia bacterium]|nr:HAD-IIA family hydrolase [Clostridia bacterium]
MERLQNKSLYLLDMDGTIYFENELIDGAADFLKSLRDSGRDYIFMTNNSSKSSGDYLKKLKNLNIPADESNIFTSGQATGNYLLGLKKSPRIYLVGTESLKKELISMGIEVSEDGKGDIDYVLVGYDTELTYRKLEIASGLLDDGIPFYATNPDVVCPAKNKRYLPDCATMCYMLNKATGKEPFYIGKPRKEMALSAVSYKGKKPEDAVLVGDRIYTDIACGLNAGILTVMVLSGESTVEDIEKYNIHPDIVTDSVKDLIVKN